MHWFNHIQGTKAEKPLKYIQNYQLLKLRRLTSKPYVLNDSIVQRTIKVYTEQLDFTQVFEKQLLKWEKEEYLFAIAKPLVHKLSGSSKLLSINIIYLMPLLTKYSISSTTLIGLLPLQYFQKSWVQQNEQFLIQPLEVHIYVVSLVISLSGKGNTSRSFIGSLSIFLIILFLPLYVMPVILLISLLFS